MRSIHGGGWRHSYTPVPAQNLVEKKFGYASWYTYYQVHSTLNIAKIETLAHSISLRDAETARR